MHGIPGGSAGRYGVQISVMKYMGWGWRQLLEAPEDLIDEIAKTMNSMSKWNAQKAKIDKQKANSGSRK